MMMTAVWIVNQGQGWYGRVATEDAAPKPASREV
jgi:hypothetical protein